MDRQLDRSARIWAKVRVGAADECWPFIGRSLAGGYGRITPAFGEPRQVAHRAAWEAATGERVPEGLFVLHRCDFKLCCNPAHLYIGTRSDNGHDRAERQPETFVRGEQQGRAKLTEELVRSIRALTNAGLGVAAIARRLEQDEGTVRNVTKGRTWRHVA